MLYRHHIFSVVGRANAATLPTLATDRVPATVTIRNLDRRADERLRSAQARCSPIETSCKVGHSVDGWFEDNVANHAATARAIEEHDAERAAMGQVLVSTGPSCLAARPAPAAGTAGTGGLRRLRKK
jgi:hypothetical protein